MKGIYATVGALATLFAQTQANSDQVTLYIENTATYITEVEATLVLPALPSPVTGDVSIWSAIMMQNQASFLQGVTSNSPSSSYCANGGSDWCNFAYTLVGNTPTVGKGVTAAPGATVRTHYKLNPTTDLWDQDVYINGALDSSVSTSKGQKGQIFYISIECASGVGTCAEHPAHKWEDVSVVLNQADESFKHTGAWADGATGGVMSTPDGGKTWNFTTISVPAQKAQ